MHKPVFSKPILQTKLQLTVKKITYRLPSENALCNHQVEHHFSKVTKNLFIFLFCYNLLPF